MLDDKALRFMKDLIESFGPSGFERDTARIVKSYVKQYADEVLGDKLGSVVAVVRGKTDRPHILLAGHMDEIGFVVSGIDEKTGFLTFSTLGGWWDQVLLSQRVVIRTHKGDLHGVIAAKPPHLLPEEERKKVITQDEMFIDIGATSKEAAEGMGVRIGDPVTPWSPFSVIHEGKIAMGKAFDDRVGTFAAIEVVRKLKEGGISHPNTVFAVATVQEEVGLRGARTASHLVDPDVGIVLEVDISGDMPGIKPHQAPTRMGKGPSILTYDRSMIPNQSLKELIIQTAEETGIPYQLSISTRGGTDAGAIHINRMGCPSIVIGVPTRHIHSHVGLLVLEDVENAVKLTVELVKKLDEEMVKDFFSV